MPIHAKPKDRNKETADSGSNILSPEFSHTAVVLADLRINRCAVHVPILWLNNGNRVGGGRPIQPVNATARHTPIKPLSSIATSALKRKLDTVVRAGLQRERHLWA